MTRIKNFTLGILGATILSFGLYSCSNDDTTTNNSTKQTTAELKETELTPEEIDKLVLNLKSNVELINKVEFYEFSKINDINYQMIEIIEKSNGDRKFLLENTKNLTEKEQIEAAFIFDLTTKIINEEFIATDKGSTLIAKSSNLAAKGKMTWRCAQAIAMGTAVTIGAIGITAGSGGAALGLALFVIGKAYSVQDIVENCR